MNQAMYRSIANEAYRTGQINTWSLAIDWYNARKDKKRPSYGRDGQNPLETTKY
jgi:hypothetical protein